MNCHAVIVAHQPNLAVLDQVIQAISPQVEVVHVVHNGVGLTGHWPANIRLLELGANLGLAAAQNRGIQAADQAGAQAVLLLDQDSVADSDLCTALHAAWMQARADGRFNVAAIGPQLRLSEGPPGGIIRLSWRRGYALRPVPLEADWLACDQLMASGTLMPLEAWRRIGGFCEALFIDRVDTEWCLRAQAAGWQLIAAPRAVLYHRLGIGRETLRLGPWKVGSVNTHSPGRYYWMVRNALWLLRSPACTACAAWAEIRQLLRMMVGLLLLSPQRAQRWPAVWRGLRDGLRTPPMKWPTAQPPKAQ